MIPLVLVVLLGADAPPSERLHVEWLAPVGCPDGDGLTEAIAASVPPDHTFHAAVRIDEPSAKNGPWRAVVTITTDDTERTRVVDGPDCARVSDAAVLVITLAATTLPEQPPQRENAAPLLSMPPKVTTGSEDDDQGGADQPARPPEPWSFRLRVQPSGGGNVGIFPGPSLGWGIAVGTAFGRARVQLGVSDSTSVGTPSGRSVSGDVLAVTARGCWLFDPHERVRLGPCLAADLGRIAAKGTGVLVSYSSQTTWGAALGGLTAGFPLSRSITPWATAEIGVNVVRPRFNVTTGDEVVTVHGVGWVVGRLTLGLEFELSLP